MQELGFAHEVRFRFVAEAVREMLVWLLSVGMYNYAGLLTMPLISVESSIPCGMCVLTTHTDHMYAKTGGERDSLVEVSFLINFVSYTVSLSETQHRLGFFMWRAC